MKFYTCYLLFTFFTLLYNHSVLGQSTIEQNEKFQEILNERKNLNISPNFKFNYKIQIFNGDIENAKKTVTKLKQDIPHLDFIIEFNAPNYKVWAGTFVNKIDAERNLQRIQINYPSAFIIRPTK
jgi:hypothetical protein